MAESAVRSPNRATASPVWPSYGRGAIGALGFDGILATHGDERALPIASITKVVTALVILEKKPLDVGDNGPDIVFTADDVAIYHNDLAQDASVVPVAAGLVLTERQAIEAILIPSASNYAQSLAIWAFGSVEAYLHFATTWLTAHGLTQTTVVDTSGLSPLDVSSTANLVELGKIALANPTVASIANMQQTALPGIGIFPNTNKLLGVDGVTGIKTGSTDEAGSCLLFAKPLVTGSQTVMIVGVLLGQTTHPQLNDDIQKLLTSITENFHELTVVAEGETFGAYSTAWGQTATVIAAATSTVVVWSDTPISITARARPISLETANTEVGAAKVIIGTKTMAVPLKLAESTSDPGAWWRLIHPERLFR